MPAVQSPALASARRRAVPDPIPVAVPPSNVVAFPALSRHYLFSPEGLMHTPWVLTRREYKNHLEDWEWAAGQPERNRLAAVAEAERIERQRLADIARAEWEAQAPAREAARIEQAAIAEAARIAREEEAERLAEAARRAASWAWSAAEMPAVEPCIEGLIDRREVGIEAGFTGTFKTQDALELSVAIILPGKTWKGRKVLHNGPVLYLGLEDAAAIRHIRLPAVMDAMNLSPEERATVLANFFMQPHGAVVKLPEALDKITSTLCDIEDRTGKEVALVVLDTVREALDGSVSAEKDAGPFMDALFELATFGPVVLALGHVSREDAKRPLSEQAPKGLGDFLDRAAFVLMKGRNKVANTTELHVLKSKNHARDYSIRHTLEPGPRGIPVQRVITTQEAPSAVEAKATVAAPKRGRGRPKS